MKDIDVIVIGMGIMGSATAYHCARSGKKVLALEGGGPTHDAGSSHGETRIFRRAYWEGGMYLPLLNRADILWNRLEKETGESIIIPTGGIFIGEKSKGVVEGSRKTAIAGNIHHEVLHADAVAQRFPAFAVDQRMEAIYEPGAYALLATKSRLLMQDGAVKAGARIQFGSCVNEISSDGTGVRVETIDGDIFRAESVVFAGGPWVGSGLVPDIVNLATPKRIPVFWFSPKSGYSGDFSNDRLPVFLYEHVDGHLLYGFPNNLGRDVGVKIGFHNRLMIDSVPDGVSGVVNEMQIQAISQYVSEVFPNLDPSPNLAKSCFYTMSRDESFLVGQSRFINGLFYISACSGHGFKFASALGEMMANMVCGRECQVDPGIYHPSRFGTS